MHSFDRLTIEVVPRARVLDDPSSVGRPDIGVSQHMTLGRVSKLSIVGLASNDRRGKKHEEK